MPIGILVSVIGHRWLDVDRLISAAVSFTIVGLAVLGGAAAVFPRLAQAAAPPAASSRPAISSRSGATPSRPPTPRAIRCSPSCGGWGIRRRSAAPGAAHSASL
jgi:hypothetical protein